MVDTLGALMSDAYWIAEPEDIIARNIEQYAEAQRQDDGLSIHCTVDEERGATLVSVIAQDHPGLFYRIAGGIHLAGANIIDARVHTASDGTAIDNFLVQDRNREPFSEEAQIERLRKGIRDALMAKVELVQKLAARPLPHSRSKTFKIAPSVTFDNEASNRFTVIEVSARDRPALLNRLAYALFKANVIIQSAHFTAYGESAADTFYVTDPLGAKITSDERLAEIRKALLSAASDKRQRQLESAQV